MENYKLEATDNTPLVELDASAHKIKFTGDSRPEDVQNFFHPILDWLDEYSELLKSASSPTEVTCHFEFDYFNSSSAKYVMDIIDTLGEIKEEASNVSLKVNWHYDEMDEDMLEAGEEFQDMLEIPFNFVKID